MDRGAAIATVVGLLNLLSGFAGIAVGGSATATGWWLVIVGAVLLVAAWRHVVARRRT